jgi:hypothetical protein
MGPQKRNVEYAIGCSALIICTLTSFSLLFLGFQAEGAATSVPRQLYGKSVVISRHFQSVVEDQTAGKMITANSEITDIFYFSSLGRIFARSSHRNQYGSRTFEQVDSDPNRVQRPTLATGGGRGSLGTIPSTFQDFHFEGRTLIAIKKVGENGATRMAIAFDQNFGTCALSARNGTDNGKPLHVIGWDGHVLRPVSAQRTSEPTCVIRDGNAFAQ